MESLLPVLLLRILGCRCVVRLCTLFLCTEVVLVEKTAAGRLYHVAQ